MWEQDFNVNDVREIRTRTCVYFGCGAINKIADIAKEFKAKGLDKVIVMSGRNAYKATGAWDVVKKAFDENGMYQYTASFYKHTNGVFGMAVHDGILYVRDCIHNIYSLKDGILIEFYERDAVPVWMQQLDFQASSPDFQVRFGSVWYVTAENE